MTFKNIPGAVFLLALAPSVLLPACGNAQLASRWPEQAITIDGRNDDWKGITPYRDKTGVSVAVANDSTDLYLCVILRDRAFERQFLTGNLTLWFDPDGGTHKQFGIRYPLGPEAGPPPPEDPVGPPDDDLDGLPPQDMPPPAPEMELLGPNEGDRTIVPLRGEEGILVQHSRTGAGLVDELRIPLDRIKHRAAGSNPGKTVLAVGLETPSIDRQKMDRGSHQNPPPGMGEEFPGPGGGAPGPGGGAPGPGGPPRGGMPGNGKPDGKSGEPLKIWVSVKLADAPSPVPAK